MRSELNNGDPNTFQPFFFRANPDAESDSEHPRQNFVVHLLQRIFDSNAAYNLAVLHILAQQHGATG